MKKRRSDNTKVLEEGLNPLLLGSLPAVALDDKTVNQKRIVRMNRYLKNQSCRLSRMIAEGNLRAACLV
jgi:hypothetical protein